MSANNVTKLVYLHGIGPGDENRTWLDALQGSLLDAGYPRIDEARVIEPRYTHMLKGHPQDEEYTLPPVKRDELREEELQLLRRRLERRLAYLEDLLGADDVGRPLPLNQPVELGARIRRQARKYLDNRSHVRARVLQKVINAVPPSARIVIVGHSLGSLVAMDVIRRLPPTVDVAGLITLGSPAGHPTFHKASDRLQLRSPTPNVEHWVNFWSPGDVITLRGGISHHFPWVLDRRLTISGHRSRRYLETVEVGNAVGWSLFGSTSRALAHVERRVESPPDLAESMALLGVVLGHATVDAMEDGKRRERYRSALSLTQATRAADLARAYEESPRPVPTLMADFIRDSADFDERAPCPEPPQHLSKSEAALLLPILAAQNPIAPYEIGVSEAARTEAMAALTERMGLGSRVGRHTATALEFARKEITPRRTGFPRWALLGLGAAALVAGPVGLAAAAPAGLAGGAAIVGALSAFGPGGMVGGLVTYGALAGSGAGAVVGSLIRSGSTDEVEDLVVYQVALSMLRHTQGLLHEDDAWDTLSTLQRETIRQLTAVKPFSDAKATSVRSLELKLAAIERGLTCIRTNQWLPRTMRAEFAENSGES